MTNMEGVGLLFLAFFIGLPLLCLVIVVGYLVHRNQIKKIQNRTDSTNRNAYTSYLDAVKDFLIHPDSFFKNLAEEPVSLFNPFILITIGGIFLSFSYLFIALPHFMGGGIVNIIFLSLTGGIIFLFFCYIFWILTTLVLYVITSCFKGTGLLIKTAQNIGFGVAFCLIVMAGFLLVTAVISTIFHVSLNEYGGTAGNNSLITLVITLGSLIISLWTTCLWIFGMKYARNLSLGKAAISVIVPVGIYLVYIYSSYIRTLY